MISTKIKDIDMLSVLKHFIEVGFKKLAVGGKLVMVTKRLVWYKKKERVTNNYSQISYFPLRQTFC